MNEIGVQLHLTLALMLGGCVTEQTLANPGAGGTGGAGQTSGSDPTTGPAPTTEASSSGTEDTDDAASSSETGGEPETEACPDASLEAGCEFVSAPLDASAPEDSRRIHVRPAGETELVQITAETVPLGLSDPIPQNVLSIGPGGNLRWTMPETSLTPGPAGSNLRVGRLIRITSSRAIRAEQEVEFDGQRWSMTPVATLPLQHEVLAPTRTISIIAVTDETSVEWQPLVATAGNGLPVEAVEAGETGSLLLNRYQVLQLAISSDEPQDATLQGTTVTADAAIVCLGCDAIP